MVVTLTDEEVRIASFIGKQRRKSCRANEVKDRTVCKQDPIAIETDGFLAEIAFAKAFNLYPDFSISVRSGGADFVINGKTVDVKATRYTNGKLLATLNKATDPCDYYVLGVVQQDNVVKLCGMVSKEELFLETNIHDLGYGGVYAIPQNKLNSLSF